MSLAIAQRSREGITILDLRGRLIVGEPVTSLREKIRELSAAGNSNIVLNLEQVDYIDSTGLGALVAEESRGRSQDPEPQPAHYRVVGAHETIHRFRSL